ncbi:unnamed protein product, partial [marine sediment metagenome]
VTPKAKGPGGLTITKDTTTTSFVTKGGKKSAPEYLQKMWEPKPVLKKTPKSILEPVSYTPKPRPVPKAKIAEAVTKDAKPFMVGGTGIVAIPYAATGQYERTIGGAWSVDLPAQELTIPPQGVLQADGVQVTQTPEVIIK